MGLGRGRIARPSHRRREPALRARRRALGYALLRFDERDAEVVVLHSLEPRSGAGSALLEGAREAAARAGCRRVWLITTNDNVDAIRFYQRCGWDWVAFHRDALEQSRRLKPAIPERGAHGIPIRHELEFELVLGSYGSPSQ